MSDNSKNNVFRMLTTKDLDFISGGAKVFEKINNDLLQTSRAQRCNCSCFQSFKNGVGLDICDNCVHAQAPYEGSEITYCSRQSKN